ncbi:MAG: hypothetical protein WBG92_19615, partial [Thiohalocapsa sp.]
MRTDQFFLYLALALILIANGARAADSMVVVKAEPDECYNGVGEPFLEKDGECPAGTVEKRNQTYGWALTGSGPDLWVGTGANVSCLGATAGAIFSGEIPSFEVVPNCLASPAPCLLVCEGPNSEFLFAQFPNLAPLIDRIGGSLIGV